MGLFARDQTPDATTVMSDAEIIACVRNGDVDVVEMLYKTHYHALCRFANAFVRSAALSEEVVDDVFLLLWRRRLQWNPHSGVLPYLFGAVRNRALNVDRNERSLQLRHADALQNDAIVTSTESFSRAAERELEIDETTRSVWDAIERLSERSRTVLTLRWQHAMTPDQIAEIMGTSRAGVQMQHSRALKALRGMLGEYLSE